MDTGEINVIIFPPIKYCLRKDLVKEEKQNFISPLTIFFPPNALSMKSEQLYHSLGGKKYRHRGGGGEYYLQYSPLPKLGFYYIYFGIKNFNIWA
jgi:hypothetical protein